MRLLRRAVLALGAAGLALSAWLARGRAEGWLLIALGLLMLWAGWRHGRLGLAWGHLRVDARGAAYWRNPDANAVAVRVERWFAGERFAWLRLRDEAGGGYEILVGRGSIGEDGWRRLSSWLAWLKRGAAA